MRSLPHTYSRLGRGRQGAASRRRTASYVCASPCVRQHEAPWNPRRIHAHFRTCATDSRAHCRTSSYLRSSNTSFIRRLKLPLTALVAPQVLPVGARRITGHVLPRPSRSVHAFDPYAVLWRKVRRRASPGPALTLQDLRVGLMRPRLWPSAARDSATRASGQRTRMRRRR